MLGLLGRRMSARCVNARPVLLCADFDETITERDTISLLFQLAPTAPSRHKRLVDQYVDELDTFLREYEAIWQHQRPAKCFDADGLNTFLDGYADTDLRSLKRVINSHALQGVRQEDVKAAAGTVQVRESVLETLKLADEWSVISVNWSDSLVRAVLDCADFPAGDKGQVVANELVLDNDGVATGEIEVKVQSPADKARWVSNLRSTYATTPSVVYVGDSANDLLAMLEADVGIWLTPDVQTTSSKLLQRLTQYYGIDVVPLVNYRSLDNCVAASKQFVGEKPVIFKAGDWLQLTTALKTILQQ